MGWPTHLATLRTTRGYERFLEWGKGVLGRTPVLGPPIYDTLHGVKKGLKDIVAPQGMFEDLGLKYIGPVDGHDIEALEQALRRAKSYGGPVIVHALTRKGLGYAPAENDEADRFHAVRAIDPATGVPLGAPRADWTSVFAEEMVRIGHERADVVGITAAMLAPVGLDRFAAQFPERVFDVGIAEQHAVTSAAGLALEGLHPVVAVYATFLNRAFDQVLMDVALHRAGVTFVLDRAGVTGDDGASHNGMWDMAMLQVVPRLRLAAPRDGTRLREQMREAVGVSDAPTVVRFPKGAAAGRHPGVGAGRRAGRAALAARQPTFCWCRSARWPALCLEVAERAATQGVGVTVVDPRWVIPAPDRLAELAGRHRLVVTVEDGLLEGGVGQGMAAALAAAGVDVPVRSHGLPRRFLEHGSRSEVLAECGMTAQEIARSVVETVARLDGDVSAPAGQETAYPGDREGREAAPPGRRPGGPGRAGRRPTPPTGTVGRRRNRRTGREGRETAYGGRG